MPSTAHFQNLPAVVCQQLATARQRLRIAVCWFSHREIFDLLLQQLRAGIPVELILEYDAQNIRPQGLPFQRFLQLGGQLYAYRDTALMHHKFALIDEHSLLSGSFNWTYSANAENLLLVQDPEVLAAFRDEFYRLKGLSLPIRKIRPAEVKPLPGLPFLQQPAVQLADLRRQISAGASVWWLRMGRQPGTWAEHFRAQRLPFDPTGILQPYWTACGVWDEALFDELWPALQAAGRAAQRHGARQLARRMRVGDLVLALSSRQTIAALGLVQSDPKPFAVAEYSSYRELQWLRVFPEAPVALPRPVSAGPAGRLRSSGLQVVQEIWER
ncbi:MAG: hypothetical protein IT260_13930 [Saprospiraceae bacterium]|nr:hypothetical protein [Saprospiraceae bacterium]